MSQPTESSMPLTGRRRPDTAHLAELPDDLRAGDYWHTADEHLKPGGSWLVYIPGGPVARIDKHHVEEHEDGTITVEPGGGGISNSIPGHSFHGWIRRGVWSES